MCGQLLPDELQVVLHWFGHCYGTGLGERGTGEWEMLRFTPEPG
jgi:hypothetical protein